MGLLAQSTQEGLSGTTQGVVGVAFLSVLGLVGWLLRLAHGKTIPEMQTAFANALDKLTAKHAEMLDRVANAFVSASTNAVSSGQAITNKLIEVFQQEQKEARTLFREQSAEERTVCERRHQENLSSFGKRHEDMMQAFKETRHEIKNLMQVQSTFIAVGERVLDRLEPPLKSPPTQNVS